MKFNDFLSKYNLQWKINKFSEPNRFCIDLRQDILSVYVMQDGRKVLCVVDGETCKKAVDNLIEMIKGQRLRIIGYDSKDNYIDIKIKVPNDLEIGEV